MKYSSLNDLSDGMIACVQIDTAEFRPHLKELCHEIQPN